MEDLKNYLEKNFGKEHYQKGELTVIKLEPKENIENKILIVAGEHGDKPQSTKAIMEIAKKLKKKSPKKTSIDIIPVLDTEGYPNERTIIAEKGLGNSLHIDSAYELEQPPTQIRNLFEILNHKRYDLAVLVNTTNKEEAPAINGFYAITQVITEETKKGKTLKFECPQTRDIIGTIAQELKNKKLNILKKSGEEAYLGDGHLFFSEGLVIQGIKGKEKNKISEFKTRNGFAVACAARQIPAIVLYALSSEVEKEFKPVKTLKTALETILNIYEKK